MMERKNKRTIESQNKEKRIKEWMNESTRIVNKNRIMKE